VKHCAPSSIPTQTTSKTTTLPLRNRRPRPRSPQSSASSCGDKECGIAAPPSFALVTAIDLDDAQQVADHLKQASPVIVDFGACSEERAGRLLDFAGGLTYALDAKLSFLGERVVLLAPGALELSREAPGTQQASRFFNRL
jgi:FtsZ-interacting cell division protein YlmF